MLLVLAVGQIRGLPPLPDQAEELKQRTAKLKAELTDELAAEPTAAGKAAVLTRVFSMAQYRSVQWVVFEHIPTRPDTEIDRFLIDVLTSDADAQLRSLAARSLGTHGTDQCLPALAKAAATNKETALTLGCVVTKGTARNATIFAIAELAARHPKVADQAASALRGLAPPVDPHDTEAMPDICVQALYQVTQDEKLVAPFLERLLSKNVKIRRAGANALELFKPKVAPPELVAALSDEKATVRFSAAVALGQIADPKTVPVLMTIAGDPKQDTRLRYTIINGFGRMKVAAATDLIRKLVGDDEEPVREQAAIALYRLTGEKLKQFPAGYNAD